MSGKHVYNVTVEWTGNKGVGTSNYRAYERSHTVMVSNKADLHCSSDPTFLGDKTKHNPEELFVTSIATCHMLWYLHLCAEEGVVVVDYSDMATGVMEETQGGGGHFINVTLSPIVTVSQKSMTGKANDLHHQANKLCFIANSCNFPILHRPTCKVIGC